MVPHASAVIAAIVLMFGSTGSQRSQVTQCSGSGQLEEGSYPQHRYSPLESLENYDMVFHGEVVVPTKPCSLGFCAGIKVLENVTGYRGKRNTVVRVKGGDDKCTPTAFAVSGERWVIYGKRKMTSGGTPFMEVSVNDPIFRASVVPDFERLEDKYFLLRTRLDYAIDKKRSPENRLR